MAEEDKADWEIRLEKYFEKPVAEAKINGKLSGSTLQSLLIDIERTVGEAKKFLAANMIQEVKVQLDKIRGLLRALERSPSGSVEQVASLLKAGVSEKVLKEIYGVTDEEIQRARKLLETAKKRTSKWIIVHDNTVVFETGDYEEAVKRFYELQSEKGWYPPALAIFKQEHTSSENVLSNPNGYASTKTQEESITMQRIRCSNLYEALKALDLVLARAREKGELELESAISRAMELIAKKLEECPAEWYMESSSKHSSTSSNPDAEEQEYETIREKARLARAETLI